jgi:flagellar FliJ protein
MAKFVFQLEGVLKQRKWAEQEKQRALAEIQAEMNQLQGELRAMDQTVQAANLDLKMNRLTGPLDMSFLAAHRRYLNSTQRKAMDLVRKMAQVQKRLEEARNALMEAAKQRKIVEKLREKQYERWRDDQARRELSAADEAATQFAYFNRLTEQ